MATYYKLTWNGSYADKTASGQKFFISTTSFNFSFKQNWGYSAETGTGLRSMYAAPITSDALNCPYFASGTNPGTSAKTLQWLFENGYGNRIVVPIYKSSHVYIAGMDGNGLLVGCGSLTEAAQTTYTHKIQSSNTNLGTASASSTILYLDGTKYSGSQITAKATAKSGAHFTGWSGDTAYATISGTSCTIPADVASNVTVTANFAANPSLTYDANGGSSTPASQTAYGNVTLASAISFTGRTFLGWKIGSTIYPAGATYNLTANATAVAQWTNISFLNDNPSAGTISLFDVTQNQKVADEAGGYIKYSGVSGHVYRIDSSVTDFLYEKRGMYVNGAYVEPYQFTFSGADVTGTYYFAEKPLYSLSVDSPHGTVELSPPADAEGCKYAKGRVISIAITPSAGYSAAQAVVVNVDNNDVYPLAMSNNVATLDGIAFNSRVAIDYSQIEYPLSASIDDASASAISEVTVSVDGDEADTAHYGDVATFSATVANGFLFAGWYDGNGNLVSSNAVFTSTVTDGMSLTAKAMVSVSFAISYTGADGNETCVLSIDGEAYEEAFGVILGQSFDYALTLGDRTQEEKWYLDSWKDGDDNVCLMPLTGTISPVASASYTAYVKSKTATRRTLTVNTGRFGEDGIVAVDGTPYEVLGDYAPARGGATMLGATPTPPGQFNFDFFGVQYVKLTATPTAVLDGDSADAPSAFRGFFDGDGNLLTAEPSAVLLLAADRTIWAFYGSTAPVTVAVAHSESEGVLRGTVAVTGSSDEDATISDDGLSASVTQGYTATVTAIAKNGYEFKGWYASEFTGGDPISSDAEWTFTVMYARTIYAKFVKNRHSVCEWEGDPTPKAMTWRSKTYESSKPFNPSACRVDALGYNGDAKGTLLELTVDMFSAPDSAPTASTTLGNITSQDARRLPVRRMERYMQIEVKSNTEVDALLVGTSMGGLAQ